MTAETASWASIATTDDPHDLYVRKQQRERVRAAIQQLPIEDSDLSEQEFKYVRAHLDTCVYCQDRLERERALSRSLQESRPLYSAPAELRSQISAAIEEYAARGQSRSDSWWRASSLFLSWKMLVPAAL